VEDEKLIHWSKSLSKYSTSSSLEIPVSSAPVERPFTGKKCLGLKGAGKKIRHFID